MEVSGASAGRLQEKLQTLLERGDEGLTPVQVGDILEAVCAHAQELLQGDGACVTVFLPEADALEIRACTGILEPVRGTSFPVRKSVSGAALVQDRPVLENDLSVAPAGEQARALSVELSRAVSVPLPGWTGKLGTLVVVKGKGGDEFTELHQRFLSAYAVPVAFALRGAEQFQEERRRVEEEEALRARQEEHIRRLKALHDAELLVASETELDGLLQTVTDVARSMTRARYAALGVLDDDLDGLSRFITSGLSDDERARHGSPPTGKGLLGAVIRERRPIRVSGLAEKGSRPAGIPGVHHRPDSFLGVPISIGDRMYGNLYLTNKRGADGFTAEDQVLVEMLAAQAAVTIQKAELFRERDELIQRLETARRLRTRLSTYVNHDIRNALGGVALWAERLESRVRDSDDLGEMAQKIRRGAEHALRLVKDVLDLTRLEEGRLEVWPRQVRVADLVQSAVEGVRPEAESKEIELVVATDDPDLHMVADPDRVHQIVLNLLSNAVKFSPGGTTVRVESSLSADGGPDGGREDDGGPRVLIAVEDQGPGIHPDDLDRIFGVYEQARDEEDRRKGLGIGLTLSRHLAELMGGSIGVSSELGEGARFTLRLPVGKEPERRPGWIG